MSGEITKHRCPDCGSRLLSDTISVWCSLVSARESKGCSYGIETRVLLKDYLLQPELTSEIETEFTQFPVCPKCGSEDQDWWDGLTFNTHDGTEWKYDCGNCNEEVTATCYVETTFSTVIVKEQDG